MRIDAIIFDKDGTLFDFQTTWSAPILAFLERVAPGESKARAAEALGFDLATKRFRPDSLVIASTTGEVAEAMRPISRYGDTETLQILNEASGTARQMPAVPLAPCLTGLKARYALGLVTNDSEVLARAHLRQERIHDIFDFIAGYDSGYGAKPDPGQLLAFAAQTGIAPETTLMVGDSRHDLHAGRAAGMVPVGVLTGVAVAEDLADLAHVILPDIGHLQDWLDKNDTGGR